MHVYHYHILSLYHSNIHIFLIQIQTPKYYNNQDASTKTELFVNEIGRVLKNIYTIMLSFFFICKGHVCHVFYSL